MGLLVVRATAAAVGAVFALGGCATTPANNDDEVPIADPCAATVVARDASYDSAAAALRAYAAARESGDGAAWVSSDDPYFDLADLADDARTKSLTHMRIVANAPECFSPTDVAGAQTWIAEAEAPVPAAPPTVVIEDNNGWAPYRG